SAAPCATSPEEHTPNASTPPATTSGTSARCSPAANWQVHDERSTLRNPHAPDRPRAVEGCQGQGTQRGDYRLGSGPRTTPGIPRQLSPRIRRPHRQQVMQGGFCLLWHDTVTPDLELLVPGESDVGRGDMTVWPAHHPLDKLGG